MFGILDILKPFGSARRRAAGKRRSSVQQPYVMSLEVRALMAATFQGLGPGTSAAAVSADGSVVVGNVFTGNQLPLGPFHWTQSSGVVSLLDSSGHIYPGIAASVSGDGSVIVGGSEPGGPQEAWRWANGVAAPIPKLEPTNPTAGSSANSVSADGSIIAGDILGPQSSWVGAGYTLTGSTLVIIPPPSSPSPTTGGTVMSANGAVVAGNIQSGGSTAYQWENNTLSKMPGSTAQTSSATAVSPDGSVVVGWLGTGGSGADQAFEWADGSVTTPSSLPAGFTTSVATGVSNEGSAIVGYLGDIGSGSKAFIWTQANGVQDLQQVLTADGLGPSLAGWTLTEATAITPDGNTIVGNGIGPQGAEGWIVTLNAGGGGSGGTMTSLQSSSLSPVYGQQVTLTATVSPDPGVSGTPTGSVAFYDGATYLGTASLTGDTATLPVSTLPVGLDAITASYGGDSQFGASTSPPTDVTAQKDGTSVSLKSSATTAVIGQTIAFTAVVSPVSPGGGTPTGSVTFYYGATDLGTKPLIGGAAVLPVASLPMGKDAITASYDGDPDFTGNTSNAVPETITTAAVKYGAQTILTTSAKSAIVGHRVKLTATVKPTGPVSGSPSGTVTFMDGGTTLGTISLSRGKATLKTSGLHLGTNRIEVIYSGDKYFNGGMSPILVETIEKPKKKAK